MRQAGIIAAAGIIALEKMVDRLSEDHINAKKLAVGLSKIPNIGIDIDQVQTNIIFFEIKEVSDLKLASYILTAHTENCYTFFYRAFTCTFRCKMKL